MANDDDNITEEQRDLCNFKVIKKHPATYWESWNTASIMVQPAKRVTENSLFTVSVLKYSFDQSVRSKWLIEATSENQFSFEEVEQDDDEWFMA